MRRLASLSALTLIPILAAGCGDDAVPEQPIRLTSDEATVVVKLAPFELSILDAQGKPVLATATDGDGAYGTPAATVDTPFYEARSLPGWDGYVANEAPWRRARRATVVAQSADAATFEFEADGLALTLEVALKGARVRLGLSAHEKAGAESAGALNKTTLAFALGADEHFYGLGERFASVDHRGLSLYSWAEEGALGGGEDEPPSPQNPLPNGPSMTYFPVPFFLSSHGYGVHLDTTYRSEVHLGSESPSAWRAAVNTSHFDATIYVHQDPLATLADYTEDTGRPPVPAQWVFGPRRRVNRGALVDGVPEYLKMRQAHIPVTGIDDAVHFLPALSHVGVEADLVKWTSSLHATGYKALAYNNPYIATDDEKAKPDYDYGVANDYLMLGPDGEVLLTDFISGKLHTLATIDLTNEGASAWFQDLLRRTLALGYDGWMHDFGEYTRREAVLSDGRRGDEVHNQFPVLSAKAAYEMLEKERPGDYLFFVRSGYSGTQRYVPAVWGGDAEANFDETQGLPSSVRGGLNLAMSGVPYWGSDMTGFKCLNGEPHDKEVFLRWVEFGAVSPIMMEQDACSNPVEKQTKWKLWNDQETIDHYRKYAGLHTRLQPYFLALAQRAHATGRPITLHPFLVHPEAEQAWGIEDSYYLGDALYASPVVRRGVTEKTTWLPPGRYVDWEDLTVYEGGATVTLPAPLGKLPLLLVAGQILPMLDPAIETLAPASDPGVVTLAKVEDRLDVVVALEAGQSASFVLADGTTLEASRGASDQGNPGGLAEVGEDAIADCASCVHSAKAGEVARVQVNGAMGSGGEVVFGDLTLKVSGGPARRVRWEVLRLQ